MLRYIPKVQVCDATKASQRTLSPPQKKYADHFIDLHKISFNCKLQTSNSFHFRIILMKIWNGFYAFIEIYKIIFFVRAMQVIAI